MTSIRFLAQNIEKAIQISDFFDIDYEKYGKDIIDNVNIPNNEKNRIQEMFKSRGQKNATSNYKDILSKSPVGQAPKVQETQNKQLDPHQIKENYDHEEFNQKNAYSNTNINIHTNTSTSTNTNANTNINTNTNTNSKANTNINTNIYTDHNTFTNKDTDSNANSNSSSNSSTYNSPIQKIINLSSYQIIEKISQNDFYSIYKICDINTKKLYSAKQLKRGIKNYPGYKIIDYAQEVRISLQLNHPCIIRYVGYSPKSFKDVQKEVLVYEFSPNKSLDTLFNLIRNNKQIFEWNDTKKLINVYGIASAMSFLHANNIIHCNLEPKSIQLDENYNPKINDFEHSKDITQKIQLNDSYFRSSPIYTAPEVYSGLNYNKSSDVYAFAFIFYEIMTNEKPFSNIKNTSEIMKMTCKDGIRPDFNHPINENYRKLIEKCWAQDPNNRPTFSAILQELETNEKFITDSINKDEFYKYIECIKKSNPSLISVVPISEFDNYIQKRDEYLIKDRLDNYLSTENPHIVIDDTKKNYYKLSNIKYQDIYDVTKKLIFIYGIAVSMEYLHSHNIIHRDLNPKNVYYDYFDSPKISGFDISIELDEKSSKDKRIIMKEIKGTAAYLAPEVYLNKEYSEKSDVYSYSLIMYELFTNHKPFEGSSNAQEIKEIICEKEQRPEITTPINQHYKELIERCWSQNPKDRPTFSEIVKELETNEKYLTYEVNRESYFKYVEAIKDAKWKNQSEKRIKELDDYYNSKSKDDDVKINISFTGAFDTETSNITFNPIYFNLKEYEKQKEIYKGNDYKFFEIQNKKTKVSYIAKSPYSTIPMLYQHQFINFLNELNVVLQLDHPSILKFIGYCPIGYENSKNPLLVFERANSKLLYYVQSKELNDTKKLIILYGIAAGMEYLHSHNILHRDLKTENIFLDSTLTPKISGFNISIELDEKSSKDKKIMMKEIKGTAAYLAPEVYLNKEYSEKSDVYSYSLIMYELFTNHKPFEGSSNAQEIKEIICEKEQRPEITTPINQHYKELIERCWSQNPKDRPTFSEIVKELETNKKFITENVDSEEYHKYIESIKNSESTFKTYNKIENIDKYIDFHLQSHINFNNHVVSKGVYKIETNDTVFNSFNKNLKNFVKKRFIKDEEYHKTYEFYDKEKNISYIGRVGKQAIINSYQKLLSFSKEIEIFSQLKHKALNQFEGYSMIDNQNNQSQVIFSQYASNNTLSHFLEADDQGFQIKEFDDTKRLICIYGIASAMKYLHEHNIILRNLKPQNILMDEFLYPKIEFLLQYLYEYKYNDKKIDIYLDPKVNIQKNDFTESSDVWSFGLIVYQILMKKKISMPNAKNDYEIKNALSDGKRPEYDDDFPSIYKMFIELCLFKDASKRLTFSQIVSLMQRDPNLITSTINKEEYYKYIQYIEETEVNFDKDFIKYKIEFPSSKILSKFLVNLNPLDLTKYQKVGQIGKGGFGSVYKVIDKKTGDVLAAKVSIYKIDECENDLIQNMSREVEIISQLNHFAILKYIGFSPFNFKSKPKPTIITEFAHNGSLDKIIELERNNCGLSDWDDTKKLINIYGIAAGMFYLHDNKVIHRDLKPANIFMDENLYPKIGDFGLSKTFEIQNKFIFCGSMHMVKKPLKLSQENISKDNSGFKGTLAYSAPEILAKEEYTEKGDVYAFGMIVYEILTNEILYEGMNRYQILMQISNGYRPEFKYPIPYYYKRLIEKCWNQNPTLRPSFEKILRKLEKNSGFITENVDVEEFMNYVCYVKHLKNFGNSDQSQEKKVSINSSSKGIKIKEEFELNNHSFINLKDYKKIADIFKGDYYKVSKVQEIKTKKIFAAKESIIMISSLSKKDFIEFSNEIKSIVSIDFPSLLKVIGYSPVNFKNESKSVFITEHAVLGSLDRILKEERKGKIISLWNDTKRLISIYGIAKGMSYLHSNDILHKNLKTENIYFDINFNPKVGDFGIPNRISINEILSYQTTSGLKGTPAYSSPETLLYSKYTKSSDVYSFSFIVYEIMNKEVPFKDMSMNQIFSQIVDGNRPEFYISIPDCYQQLIEKCWSQDPKDRPSFDDIVELLKSEKGFITETVNADEFYAYVKYLDDYY